MNWLLFNWYHRYGYTHTHTHTHVHVHVHMHMHTCMGMCDWLDMHSYTVHVRILVSVCLFLSLERERGMTKIFFCILLK